jgi:hypothetical protein
MIVVRITRQLFRGRSKNIKHLHDQVKQSMLANDEIDVIVRLGKASNAGPMFEVLNEKATSRGGVGCIIISVVGDAAAATRAILHSRCISSVSSSSNNSNNSSRRGRRFILLGVGSCRGKRLSEASEVDRSTAWSLLVREEEEVVIALTAGARVVAVFVIVASCTTSSFC